MAKLRQAHGNWVSRDRFWNRQHEVAAFIEYLREGAHIHLVAPRRIGKTSLMREVAHRLSIDYLCLHVDLQKARSPEDFIVELSKATRDHQSLWQKTREVFSNIFGKTLSNVESLQIDEVTIKMRDGLTGGNWQPKGDRLLEALAGSDKPIVVFMDEVPIMVNRLLKGSDYKLTPERIAQADAFMSWLRENSIRHSRKIRFVIAGSIGFEPILRQAGLSSTINNFKAFHLEPWSVRTSIGCLRALANQYGVAFQEGACERVTERLSSCVPHHVQMFFSHIYEMCRQREDMSCSVQDVDAAYDSRMLSTRGHAELSTFEERLKMMIGDDLLPFALDLLTEAAVVGHLSSKAVTTFRKDHKLREGQGAEHVREVLEILEHDGYLRQEDQSYVFVSHLLRDWWHHRFGFGFIKASDREG